MVSVGKVGKVGKIVKVGKASTGKIGSVTYRSANYRAEIVTLPDGRRVAWRPVVDDIDLDDMVDCPVIPAGASVDAVLAAHALGLAEMTGVPVWYLVRETTGA